jgi:hypothetical protein
MKTGGNSMATETLIAQSDDPELLEWLAKANQLGGGFVSAMARAALVADPYNYPVIRPAILALRAKYPQYEPTELVKREIRERAKK